MQTPPSTPVRASTAASPPRAPRRPLLIKRSKPSLSAEEKGALLTKLEAIRAKHARRALHLARRATEALEALQELEESMDEEARALYPHYSRDFRDFKLTFQHDYPERAEEYDDSAAFLENAIFVARGMEVEAGAAEAVVADAPP